MRLLSPRRIDGRQIAASSDCGLSLGSSMPAGSATPTPDISAGRA